MALEQKAAGKGQMSSMSRGRVVFRRRKVATIRLGAGERRGIVLMRMFKKMRLKWIKLKYICMLKKLKVYYRNMIKDMIEASASLEAFQHRVFMESTFGVPVLGISSTSTAGSDRRPSFYI
ncbi:hypothetical protein ACFE04_003762 [Oxalis oulophora]